MTSWCEWRKNWQRVRLRQGKRRQRWNKALNSLQRSKHSWEEVKKRTLGWRKRLGNYMLWLMRRIRLLLRYKSCMKIKMRKSDTKSQHLKALANSSSAIIWTLNIIQCRPLPLLMSRRCVRTNNLEKSSAFLRRSLLHLASRRLSSNHNLVTLKEIRLKRESPDVTHRAAAIAKTQIQ